MFNFNYRARVSDPTGQDVCALLNPSDSSVRITIKKIVVTTTSKARVIMIMRKDGVVNEDETILENTISKSDPENQEDPVAIPLYRPDMPEPWESARYFTVGDATLGQIVGPADDVVIPPGYRLGLRIIPYEVGQSVTIDINFTQK